MVKMNFSTQVSSPPTWSGRIDILYTCRNSIHIYPSVPDLKPVRGRVGGDWADTRDHISYSSVFFPSVSGRILQVWIINSLSAFDLYGLSLLSNYVQDLSFLRATLLIQYLQFFWFGIWHLWQPLQTRFESWIRFKPKSYIFEGYFHKAIMFNKQTQEVLLTGQETAGTLL